jgi:hypothetical protein
MCNNFDDQLKGQSHLKQNNSPLFTQNYGALKLNTYRKALEA